MDRQRAPARPDLGDAHAGLESKLGGDMDELGLLRRLERIRLRIAIIGAGIVQPLVEKEAEEIRRQVVMVADVLCRDAERIGLLPALHPAPGTAQELLRSGRRETAAIDREDFEELMDGRAVLEGQRPVHIGFGGDQFGIERKLAFDSAAVKPHRDGRAIGAGAIFMQRAGGIVEPQAPVSNELFQKSGQQPHQPYPSPRDEDSPMLEQFPVPSQSRNAVHATGRMTEHDPGIAGMLSRLLLQWPGIGRRTSAGGARKRCARPTSLYSDAASIAAAYGSL